MPRAPEHLPPMHLWNEARVAIYGRLQRSLPAGVRAWIGRSQLTAPFRRWFLWPRGAGRLVGTNVLFEGHRFHFAAPLKVTTSVRQNGGIENGLCRLVLSECGSGAVALDVGANYGFISLVMACAVGAKGTVHAFEADTEIASALAENIRLNNFEDRCRVVEGFVGDTCDGRGRLTVDDYVSRVGLERVDFLKIDVDGPDHQVLEGARKTLQRFHPVVVIEMTNEQPAILALLRELGYECADMRGQEVNPAAWPPNLLAAVGRRLAIPPRSR